MPTASFTTIAVGTFSMFPDGQMEGQGRLIQATAVMVFFRAYVDSSLP